MSSDMFWVKPEFQVSRPMSVEQCREVRDWVEEHGGFAIRFEDTDSRTTFVIARELSKDDFLLFKLTWG